MSDTTVDRAAVSIPAKGRSTALRKRLLLACLGFVVFVGPAWYGHQWWTVGRFIESTDDAYVGGEVTVIAPKVAGIIAEVAVTDNQAVHTGDLLVKLDDRDYRAALEKAAAAVAEHLSASNSAMADLLQKITAADAALWGGDTVHGHAAALKRLWSLTWREAQTQTYADAFLALGVCFVIATLMAPLMRKVTAPSAPSSEAH
jgi:multidrug resistance efflux pump